MIMNTGVYNIPIYRHAVHKYLLASRGSSCASRVVIPTMPRLSIFATFRFGMSPENRMEKRGFLLVPHPTHRGFL